MTDPGLAQAFVRGAGYADRELCRFHEKANFVKADVAAGHVKVKQFVSPRFHPHSV
jgi:hypothetical protein